MIRFESIELRIHQQTLISAGTLQVNPGDKVVLSGPSGCGKSSLLKTVVGALPIAAGQIIIDDEPLTVKSAASIRSKIAFIGQEPILGADTVRDAPIGSSDG